MGRAKFALAVVASAALCSQSAAARLVIDDFEEGAFMFADRGGVVAPPVSTTDPEGNAETSKEQSGLTRVFGGVRLVTIRASQLEAMTAALVPVSGQTTECSCTGALVAARG